MSLEIEEKNAAFERDLRRLHATAVSHVSPQTLARLRTARHAAQTAPRRGNGWRWAAATAFSAVFAVALGVQFLPLSNSAPATPMVASAADDQDNSDALSTLDESPDLYMWLASPEAAPLAME
jgi:anti-sigma-K factor RskA